MNEATCRKYVLKANCIQLLFPVSNFFFTSEPFPPPYSTFLPIFPFVIFQVPFMDIIHLPIFLSILLDFTIPNKASELSHCLLSKLFYSIFQTLSLCLSILSPPSICAWGVHVCWGGGVGCSWVAMSREDLAPKATNTEKGTHNL